MKLKRINILAMLGVGFIATLTSAPTLKDVHGALTAPASYNLSYQYYSGFPGHVLGTSSLGDYFVGYTRTSDGVYYNYSTTITHDSHADSVLPEGLDITMTFNRSNTTWQQTGSLYYPTDTKIGSNNAVGTVIKTSLLFVNNTPNDYRLYFDNSSTGAFSTNWVYDIEYDGIKIANDIYTTTSFLTSYVVPSYFTISLKSRAHSSQNYIDAWYLQDLGVSASYDAGYDAGYDLGEAEGYSDGLGNNPNVLLSGFQAMVGILVNFMLMILNLEVFGVSIMSVFGILALFVGVVWILKIVRG